MHDLAVKTIVFDFGNVIAHFDYRIAAERLGRPIGLSGEALMKIALERDFHPLLMELESGRIHELVFFEELKKRLSLPQSIEQIAADWADIFTANQPVHNLAHQLKDEGYQLVLGSNTNAVHARQFRSQFDELLSRFDALITSHEVGEMKPHSLFYQRCCEAVDARPEECVFIDDIQENVLGAQDAGLYGVHYTTIDRLKSSLRSLGVSL